MNLLHHIRLTVRVAVVAVSLVAVAPAAAADGPTRPDDRATRGPGALVARGSAEPVRPDDRAIPRPQAVAVTVSPEVVRPDDRATRGPGPVAPITPIAAEPVSDGGFDWMDAGIGAVSALGLGLLGIGLAVVALRQRRRTAYS